MEDNNYFKHPLDEMNYNEENNNAVGNENNVNETPNTAENKHVFSKTETRLIIKLTILYTLIFSFISTSVIMFIGGLLSSAAKPIIYLYPTEETDVSVELGSPEKLTCSYPKYEGVWEVKAKPNGDLVDLKTGRNLYSLYWEGKCVSNKEITEGFCVNGEDSAKFLEEKLAVLGLTEREAEEFIVYWLPKLEQNKYNLISFETMEEIDEDMALIITPKPDTIIRVMMKFKGLDRPVEIPEQKLETPARIGFVAVEWGGTELK